MSRMVSENSHLEEKSAAYDRQIKERIDAGHIPDLRRVTECRYFYNNSWRHPAYVKLDFEEQFTVVLEAIRKHAPLLERPLKILEVGCGPGFLSLELARNTYAVTGLDISEACIEVALRFAEEDPWEKSRGDLHYLTGDYLDPDLFKQARFDVIVFKAALHLFSDQPAVMRRTKKLLSPGGLMIALEPARDRITEGNAAFLHMVRVLLSLGGGYYQHYDIPENLADQRQIATRIHTNIRNRTEGEEGGEPGGEHEASYTEMLTSLHIAFPQVEFTERYGFFHGLIGGLRFEQEVNDKLARYLRDVDSELCRLGVIQPTEFFYVGKLG